MVWRAPADAPEGSTPHSAILTVVVLHAVRHDLDAPATQLLTKNGLKATTTMTLNQLFTIYGETFAIYHRRSSPSS